MLEDFFAQSVRVEIMLAKQGIDRRLLIRVEHRGSLLRRRHAELLARIDRASRLQNIHAQQQIGPAIRNGAGGGGCGRGSDG